MSAFSWFFGIPYLKGEGRYSLSWLTIATCINWELCRSLSCTFLSSCQVWRYQVTHKDSLILPCSVVRTTCNLLRIRLCSVHQETIVCTASVRSQAWTLHRPERVRPSLIPHLVRQLAGNFCTTLSTTEDAMLTPFSTHNFLYWYSDTSSCFWRLQHWAPTCLWISCKPHNTKFSRTMYLWRILGSRRGLPLHYFSWSTLRWHNNLIDEIYYLCTY